MKYESIKVLFATRKKGRDFKVFHNGRVKIKQTGDGVFEFYIDNDTSPMATVDQENIFTLLVKPTSIGTRMALDKIVGRYGFYSDMSNFKKYANPIRYWYGENVNVPAEPGLKINLHSGRVVAAPADVKRVVNKEKNEELRPFINKVVKVAKVMAKLDGSVVNERPPCIDRWTAKTAWDRVKTVEISEEAIAELAQAAILKAKSMTIDVPGKRWEIDAETGRYSQVPVLNADSSYERKFFNNLRSAVRTLLLEKSNAYDKVTVNPLTANTSASGK